MSFGVSYPQERYLSLLETIHAYEASLAQLCGQTDIFNANANSSQIQDLSLNELLSENERLEARVNEYAQVLNSARTEVAANQARLAARQVNAVGAERPIDPRFIFINMFVRLLLFSFGDN